LLNARRLPATLPSEDVAFLLGRHTTDVPILVKAGVLCPLGKPAPSAPKYFASQDILELSKDVKQLSKAVECLTRHWAKKNSRRKAALLSK